MTELIGYFLALDAIFTWALASIVYKWGLKYTQPKENLLQLVHLFFLLFLEVILS